MRRQHQKIRERSARIALACASVTALAASPASAQQLDANPPLPDVMLVVDTSGSMELMMDGCNTDTGLYADGSGGGCCNGTIPCVSSSCAPGCGTQTTFCDGVHAQPQNRWAAQVAALTGTYLNSGENGAAYSCFSMPRTAGSAFANEFSYQYSSGSTASPYDLNYYLNFHRPVEPIVPTGGGTPTTACAFGFVQGASGWNAANTGTGVTHSENPPSPTQPDFAAAAIQGYVYNIATMTPVVPQTPCTMGQAENGLINFGINAIRFGLMTIDSDTLPNSGVTVTGDNGDLTFTDIANGGSTNNLTTGMWSYYNGWETPGSPPTFPGATVGRPAGCNETGIANIPYEVGARNPAAPPWEGRLMRFPGPGIASPAANNSNIMQAIRVMRPYGANPIAGLMDDAKYFFWTDPQGPSNPAVDPLGSCRPQYIILLSHAAPNEDLEPYCQGTANGAAGMCPYDYPQYIAAGLANGSYSPSNGVPNNQSASAGGTPVKTFVVGFSLQSQIGDAGEYTSCKQILQGPVGSQTVNPQYCGTPSTTGTDSGTAPTVANASAYASCCALAQIAVSGGTQAPYFADNSADLNTALAAIEAIIVNGMTTRAIPVLLPSATSASGTGGSSSALFVSSFSPSYVTSWSGNVQRERYTCPEPAAPANPYQPIATSSGDDFSYNLNNSGGQTRNVIMVEPSLNGSTRVSATSTIRPWVNGTTSPTAFDGYTMNDGTDYGYSYTTAANTVVSLNGSTYGNAPAISGPGITSDVLFPGGCSYSPPPGMTFQKPADCELMALGWLLGMQSPITDWNPTIAPYPNRYYTGPGSNPPSPSPFGGVYHSTPVVATPPSALLRDDSYQAFSQFYTTAYAENSQGAAEARHTVLYVATTDGLLHAFGVNYNSNDTYTFTGTNHANEGGTIGTQNEMWSFVPPAVLPLLMSAVGGGQSVVLDGAPVVKDTVFQRTCDGLRLRLAHEPGGRLRIGDGGVLRARRHRSELRRPRRELVVRPPAQLGQQRHASYVQRGDGLHGAAEQRLDEHASAARRRDAHGAAFSLAAHGLEPLRADERDAGDHHGLDQRSRHHRDATHGGRRRDPARRRGHPLPLLMSARHLPVGRSLGRRVVHGGGGQGLRREPLRLSARPLGPAMDGHRLPEHEPVPDRRHRQPRAGAIAHGRPSRHRRGPADLHRADRHPLDLCSLRDGRELRDEPDGVRLQRPGHAGRLRLANQRHPGPLSFRRRRDRAAGLRRGRGRDDLAARRQRPEPQQLVRRAVHRRLQHDGANRGGRLQQRLVRPPARANRARPGGIGRPRRERRRGLRHRRHELHRHGDERQLRLLHQRASEHDDGGRDLRNRVVAVPPREPQLVPRAPDRRRDDDGAIRRLQWLVLLRDVPPFDGQPGLLSRERVHLGHGLHAPGQHQRHGADGPGHGPLERRRLRDVGGDERKRAERAVGDGDHPGGHDHVNPRLRDVQRAPGIRRRAACQSAWAEGRPPPTRSARSRLSRAGRPTRAARRFRR